MKSYCSEPSLRCLDAYIHVGIQEQRVYISFMSVVFIGNTKLEAPQPSRETAGNRQTQH